jgi:hypothetical protein
MFASFVFFFFFLVLMMMIFDPWGYRETVVVHEPETFTHTHTHTTTTTTVEEAPKPEYNIVGALVRQKEGENFFVIDPVDAEKIFVGANDDMYRDAAGKIWKLK